MSHSSGFAKLYTKFDGTTLLKLLPVHFRNAPHNFTSDALNNRVAKVQVQTCTESTVGVNLTAM